MERVTWNVTTLRRTLPLAASVVVSCVTALASAGPPARWVGMPEGTPAATLAVEDTVRAALQSRGLIEELPAPFVPSSSDPSVIANLLRTGVDLFFMIELERAVEQLRAAFDAIEADPRLLGPGQVDQEVARLGLLTLARAYLHNGEEEHAARVAGFLIRTFPDLVATEASVPAAVVALIDQTRAAQAAQQGSIEWEAVGADGGCVLRVNGVDRGAESPVAVAEGDVVARVECGADAGWERSLTIGAGETARLRSAPAIEAQIGWDGRAPRLLAPLPAASRGALLAALAGALEAPVATVEVEEPGPALVARAVDGDGAEVLLARALLAPGERGGPTVEVLAGDEVPAAQGGGDLAPWGWSTLGVGVALAAGGLALHLVHDERVGSASSPTQDAIDSARSLEGASIGLYAAGGAAVVSGVVLLLIDPDEGVEPPSVGVGASPSGFFVYGRY